MDEGRHERGSPRSKSPRSPIFHHISPKPRIKTGVDSTYASKTESYVLSINHCRPRFARQVVPANSNVRPYVPLPPLLTTSFQTFVSPDSSGSSGRKMIVYRANIVHDLSFILYRGVRVLGGGGGPTLFSVAVHFYHRFRPQ